MAISSSVPDRGSVLTRSWQDLISWMLRTLIRFISRDIIRTRGELLWFGAPINYIADTTDILYSRSATPKQIFLTAPADAPVMNKPTFEITASIGSVLLLILMCVMFDRAGTTALGSVISLLVFTLVISAAGWKLANFGE